MKLHTQFLPPPCPVAFVDVDPRWVDPASGYILALSGLTIEYDSGDRRLLADYFRAIANTLDPHSLESSERIK